MVIGLGRRIRQANDRPGNQCFRANHSDREIGASQSGRHGQRRWFGLDSFVAEVPGIRFPSERTWTTAVSSTLIVVGQLA